MNRPKWSAAGVVGMSILLGLPWAGMAESLTRGDRAWDEQLKTLDSQLRQSRWEPARQEADALAREIAERSGGPKIDHREHARGPNAVSLDGILAPEEGLTLGRAVAYQAIAEAALGRQEEARWHWYLAQNLDGSLRNLDLTPYGAAGDFLRRHVLAPPEEQHAELVDVLDPVRPEGSASTSFKEPERTKTVYPRRPQDLSHRDRFSESVYTLITVNKEGLIEQPLVVSGNLYPGMLYKAFDALRQWRFTPATLDGKPVPYRYIVPVVFADDRPGQSAVFF